MPSSEHHGTFQAGRWALTRLSGEWCWDSLDGDVYKTLNIGASPEGEWDQNGTDAKSYVEYMIEEHGEGYEFMFGAMRMTMGAMLERSEHLDQCQRDPDFIAQYFRENMYPDGHWETMCAGVRTEYDEDHFLCINPSCYRSLFPANGEEYTALRQCNNCGGMTMVRENILLDKGPPDGTFQNLMANQMSAISRAMATSNALAEIASTHDKARIHYRSQRPYLYVSTDMPQLKVRGEHFIRGRVNREVLTDYGCDSNSSEMMLGLVRTSTEVINIIKLLLSDPDIILDESRAEKFRQEFIDTQWEDEFISFANELREKGTLKVDSAGVHDTLSSLYNMAQRLSGKKTIIKRNGTIVFPTQEVLENISQPLIERAFNITEHGRYEDLSEVFEAGEGA